MKALLIAMLLASPPVAAWILKGADTELDSIDFQKVAENQIVTPVRIPVEVVAHGSPSQWVYVELPSPQAVPEPGVALLLPLASLLLLHRRRSGGK